MLEGSGGLAVLTMAGVLATLAHEARSDGVAGGVPRPRATTAAAGWCDRSEPGAVLAETRGDRRATRWTLAGAVDSLCLHGDTPGAVGHARAVRAALETAGWTLRGL